MTQSVTQRPAWNCRAADSSTHSRTKARSGPAVPTWRVVYRHRRGLTIAQDSGNRLIESHLAASLAQLAAAHGEPTDAFDYLTLAIRHFYDAGSFAHLRVPLAILSTVFDRLGHHQPAATISAFAATSLTRSGVLEINSTISHLREVLGDEVYESLASAGAQISNTEMVHYAFEQIDRARAHLHRAREDGASNPVDA